MICATWFAVPCLMLFLMLFPTSQQNVKHGKMRLDLVPYHLLDLLDVSCSTSSVFIPAPKISHGNVARYSKVKHNNLGKQQSFMVAVYKCFHGYKLYSELEGRMFCSRGAWIGELPQCKENKTVVFGNTVTLNDLPFTSQQCPEDYKTKNCEHDCRVVNKKNTCFCFTGYIMKNSSCIDIDECLENNGHCEQICTNTPGSFICDCPKGLRLSDDMKSCEDINECLLRNGHGPCQDSCENTHGSYICGCSGLEGTYLSDDGHTCTDDDECKNGKAGCSHGCVNTLGQAFCTCPDGMELASDWKTCNDINECEDETIRNLCDGECKNTEGSYYCQQFSENTINVEKTNKSSDCNDDYFEGSGCDAEGNVEEKETTTSITTSTEISTFSTFSDKESEFTTPSEDFIFETNPDETTEASLSTTTLDVNKQESEIVSVEANREISTPEILTTETTTLVSAVEESSEETSTATHTTTISNEIPYNYDDEEDDMELEEYDDNDNGEVTTIRTECQKGFHWSSTNRYCTDINECETNTHNCSHICENTEGGYICSCLDGYQLVDHHTCEDLNECLIFSPCSHQCVNEIGTFHCRCPETHILDTEGTNCIKISCSHNYEMINGTINCRCSPGYILQSDQITCKDINECEIQKNDCSQLCNNLEGGYECFCEEGFQLAEDNKTCFDINECETANRCEQICENYEGGYRCSCWEGFTFDGGRCRDIDECGQKELNNCTHICDNTEGSFFCSCPNGYILDNDIASCKDVDECNIDSPCQHLCVNLLGGYQCECYPGFMLSEDGHTCRDKDECLDNNGNCSQACINQEGSYRCGCQENYSLESDGKTCSLINPCLLNNGNCSEICEYKEKTFFCSCYEGRYMQNGLCVDIDLCQHENGGCSHICNSSDGYITCSCPTNYELTNSTHCIVKNPCDDDNGGCSHHCQNIDGVAACVCPPQFELREKTCFEVNPCESNNGGCSHNCTSTKGKVKCSCPEGFRLLKGNLCKEIPSCAKDNGGCSHFCDDSSGKIVCSCADGYLLKNNKKTCKRVNDCSVNNGGCSHGCVIRSKRIACTCPLGLQLDEDNKTCININECLKNNGNCEQICTNHKGGHMCSCQQGYILKEDGRSCGPLLGKNCPVLQAPQHGFKKCSRSKKSFQKNGLSTGSKCVFLCKEGYKLEGNNLLTCDEFGNWTGMLPICRAASCAQLEPIPNGYFKPDLCTYRRVTPGEICTLYCRNGKKTKTAIQSFTCESNLQFRPPIAPKQLSAACSKIVAAPFIKCPSNGYLEFILPPGQSFMPVNLPKPHTNMDWQRHVTAMPAWGKRLTQTLSVGKTEIKYSALNPVTNKTATCYLTINVLDQEDPAVINCPENIEHVLYSSEQYESVYWDEPKFSDNVGIVSLYRSKAPGSDFQRGVHHVTYVASDYSGNRAYCYFTVTIRSHTLDNPVEIKAIGHRTVLFCPQGVKYLSYIPNKDSYVTREGCRVVHKQVSQSISNRKKTGSRIQQIYSGSIVPKRFQSKYSSFHLYNKYM